MKDNYEDDLYAECAACTGGVLRSAAFKEGRDYYHPGCAGVWQCQECGEWNGDDLKLCKACQEVKP
jgi:hypothetical protein